MLSFGSVFLWLGSPISCEQVYHSLSFANNWINRRRVVGNVASVKHSLASVALTSSKRSRSMIHRRTLNALLHIGLLLSTLFFAACSQPGADRIYHGGTIYTLNPDQPTVEAVAVRRGMVVYAGDETGLEPWRGPNTGEFDLQGGAMFPGFIDVHVRLEDLGRSLVEPDLTVASSKQEVFEVVMEQMVELRQQVGREENVWVKGSGWDQTTWKSKEFPSFTDLPAGPLPVFLMRVDNQTAWVNQSALTICGIDKNTPDPEGGRIVRDKWGNPTGIFLNRAVDLITAHIPELNDQQRKHLLNRALSHCAEMGLTGVHNFGADSVVIRLLDEMERAGELPIRVYSVIDCECEEMVDRYLGMGRQGSERDYHRIWAVRMFVDGPMGSRSAALMEPYADDPDNTGLLSRDPENMAKLVGKATEANFQVCAYTVGDRGAKAALDAYATVLNDGNPNRFRLEHAQLLREEDFGRLAEMDVIPTFMPIQLTTDYRWLVDRLGKERAGRAYAWRRMIEANDNFALGSEAPVESVNPMWGIYAAVTRMDIDGNPDGGWHPSEKLSLDEAIAGFTSRAAYAEFNEVWKGTIEKGKLADFTVYERDPYQLPPKEWLTLPVRYTIVAGDPLLPAPE
ncbi:amidohydrolase family protein [bacterium]|nr:amidohydrolase family protein [bacterium]